MRAAVHSLEAEMSVLGSMILSSEVAKDLAREMEALDFFAPAHRVLFEALRGLSATGEIDIVVLRDQLLTSGKLEEIGGVGYLLEIANYVPSAANALRYGEIVKAKRYQRDMEREAGDLARIALSTEFETNAQRFAAWQRATGNVHRSFARSDRKAPTIEEVFRSVDKSICSMFLGEQAPSRSTGFAALDAIFGGFFPGDQYCLAGYSGDGKTAMMCELMFRSTMATGSPSIIFSGEMTKEGLMYRFIQSRTGVQVNAMRSGRIDGAEYQMIADAMDEFKDLPIYVVDDFSTIDDVYSECLRVKSEHGTLNIGGLDYLQLMIRGSRNSGVVEIDTMVNDFKKMAKELQFSTLLLSQLNRESQKENRPPELRDIKASGGIEASCDVVMMLHRPNKRRDGVESADCYVRKARFAAPGRAELEFVPRRGLWRGVGEKI